MVKIALKGVASATAKGRKYYYAWRGGPRLPGEPGSPEFVAAYQAAHDAMRQPDVTRFHGLVALYRGSDDYRRLADSTRRNWAPWLDRISGYFGDLRIAQFDRPEKIRPVIRRWRNKAAATPRAADYGMQVLSRVLAYGVELGKIASNPCQGIRPLYRTDRSEIIWLADDLVRLKHHCSSELAMAVDLAACSGLRLGDLIRLSWSHIGKDEIVLPTGKSRHRRDAVIPLYDELRQLLDRIPKKATTVLTNRRGRPWTTDGFGSSFNKAKKRAGLDDRALHFHDLRGTAATRFYSAGLPERVIAEIMGWEEAHVARIIRRYVGRSAATQAVIRQLNEARKGT